MHTHTHSRGGVLTLVLPQWGAADAEIKVPSGENTETKKHGALLPQKPLRLIRDGEVGGREFYI